MKQAIVIICTTALFTVFAAAAGAQSKKECSQADNTVSDAKAARNAIEAKITKLDEALEELQQKRATLVAQRNAKKDERNAAGTQVRVALRDRDKACSSVERCKDTNEKVHILQKRFNPLKNDLGSIQTELEGRKTKADEYRAEIEKIEAEYKQLECRRMTKGETDPATVKNCRKLYTRWDSMRETLTNLTVSIRTLGRRHGRMMERLERLRAELTFLGNRTRRMCSDGPEIKDVEALEAEQPQFDKVGQAISQIDQHVIKTRKIKIREPLFTRKA